MLFFKTVIFCAIQLNILYWPFISSHKKHFMKVPESSGRWWMKRWINGIQSSRDLTKKKGQKNTGSLNRISLHRKSHVFRWGKKTIFEYSSILWPLKISINKRIFRFCFCIMLFKIVCHSLKILLFIHTLDLNYYITGKFDLLMFFKTMWIFRLAYDYWWELFTAISITAE